jgi:hypothetical protein
VSGRLTVAGWWYAFVSLTLFRFVGFRWYYRIALWYCFVWRIARTPLQLNALHPDRAGGLGFLSDSSVAFMPIMLAHTIMMSGKIGDRIWHEGHLLPQYKMEILFILLALLLVVFLPMMFFVVQLGRAQRAGIRQYGTVAAGYVNRFRDRWIRGRSTADDSILGAGDIQSLADLGNSFEVISEMRIVPFTRKAVLRLAIVLVLPLLPLLLTMIPFEQLVDRALKLVM